MVITDDCGIIMLVNAQTESLFGYSRAELLGRSVEVLVPVRHREQHQAHRRGYAGNRQVRPMGAGLDLYGLRRDGTEFPVEISLSPLETADGVLVSAAVRDVSERKAAEQRINELAVIVESSQDAIFTKTLDGHITFWNAAAHRIYGYTAEEAIGRHVSMLVPEGRRSETAGLLGRLARGERVEHLETLRVTRDGRLLDVDITIWPIHDTDGAITGASAIVRDVSDRKRAQRELTRLYEEQRRVALTLQRSLMGTPAQVPRIRTVDRYLPATQGAGVGGDWFDLIPLPDGRVGVLIGDVMGRGLEAAAVMGQLRSAAHALAMTGMTAENLMRALDAFTAGLPDQFVTCCYLIVDPDSGELSVCSAGHLPILVIDPYGDVRRLPVPVSVPLGVGDVPHFEVGLRVPVGSTLVLYTDGLVETPDSDIEEQIDAMASVLRAALIGAQVPTAGVSAPVGPVGPVAPVAPVVPAGAAAACGAPVALQAPPPPRTSPAPLASPSPRLADPAGRLEPMADRLFTEMVPDADEPADDVTLLFVHIPMELRAEAELDIVAEPAAAGVGRRFLESTLRVWGCPHLQETAALLASEVLTNAVRHARGSVSLRLRLSDQELIIEVADQSRRLPVPRVVDAFAESGRGLFLVEALSSSWGAVPTVYGKTVWFALPR